MPPVLAFDIETIPDTAALRRLHNLPHSLSDAEVADISERLLRQTRGGDFFPLHLQRVVCISCVLRQFERQGSSPAAAGKPLKIFTLPHKREEDEAEAIKTFFALLEKYHPVIVSWNGGGFDLPVLHYRAMFHRIAAPHYWRADGEYKWDNYTNRFHERHTDLMDVLSAYQLRAAARLNEVAVLCGLPGKIGSGGGVWRAWQNGDIAGIRRYCEVDALLTYLLYARFQHFRGRADSAQEEQFIRDCLESEQPRWQEFLSQWTPRAPQPRGDFLLDGEDTLV